MTKLFSSFRVTILVSFRPNARVIVFWHVNSRTMEMVSGKDNELLIKILINQNKYDLYTLVHQLHQQE